MTVLDDVVGNASSLEVVNEGGPACEVVCLAETLGGPERLTVGSLTRGQAASVRLGAKAAGGFRCVTTALDAHGRMHVWSYDGRHERLHKRQRLQPEEALVRMYPHPSE
jgi:hypothetical protein